MEVTIRPLVIDDAYTSVRWRNDPEVFKYTGNTYDHIITLESELDWIKKVTTNKSDYRCAIIADGEYVGNIYLTDINPYSATYHIFIGNRDYWGKGVARKASVQILRYAFHTLRLKTVSLKVRPENISALRLYESLGFTITESTSDFIFMNRKNPDIDDVIGDLLKQ